MRGRNGVGLQRVKLLTAEMQRGEENECPLESEPHRGTGISAQRISPHGAALTHGGAGANTPRTQAGARLQQSPLDRLPERERMRL